MIEKQRKVTTDRNNNTANFFLNLLPVPVLLAKTAMKPFSGGLKTARAMLAFMALAGALTLSFAPALAQTVANGQI